MRTVYVVPPEGGATITIQGRVYTAADAVAVAMPESDAYIATCNGWFAANVGGVQTADADLTTLAAMSSTNAAALAAMTAAGRTVINAADAAAQRTALGLGTASTHATGDYATAAQGAKADTALQANPVFPDTDPHVAGAGYWSSGTFTKSTG